MSKFEAQKIQCCNCKHWEYIGGARGICKGNVVVTDPIAKIITKKDFYCKEISFKYTKVSNVENS